MGLFDSFVASMSGTDDTGLSTVPTADRAPFNLNAVGGSLDAFGQAAGGVSHVMFGIQARQAAQFEAAQMRQNANTAEAASQRTASDIDRQTQFVTSRALAVAAGSGGGASDPTVVNLIARDAGEGAYQKQLALYGGRDRARLDNEQADAKTFEGKSTFDNSLQVGAAAYGGAAANLLKSQAKGASLFQRFGGGGPQVGAGGDDSMGGGGMSWHGGSGGF
jgi:hypothetical protein